MHKLSCELCFYQNQENELDRQTTGLYYEIY
jgi:hypothetical protein